MSNHHRKTRTTLTGKDYPVSVGEEKWSESFNREVKMGLKYRQLAPTSIVAYLRTSTKEQVLSIDSQRETVQRIARDKRCDIVRWCTEHESGGDNERPELAKALHHARGKNSILVVAKLDRLARDSAFLIKLYDGNVPIIFGDLPEVDGSAAGRLTIQTMANIAEFERKRMGERMRDWHQQRRVQGFQAGHMPNLTSEGRLEGARVSGRARTEKAIEEMSLVATIAAEKRAEGWTYGAIAKHLNAEGYVTRRGAAFHDIQVKRVLDRVKEARHG